MAFSIFMARHIPSRPYVLQLYEMPQSCVFPKTFVNQDFAPPPCRAWFIPSTREHILFILVP